MILFQWIAIPLLIAACLLELVRALQWAGQRWMRLFRAGIWAAAAAAIANPDVLGWFAVKLGIGRGADLVFYFFVLAFLIVSVLFYGKMMRLQRQITDLVRILAIQQAKKPGDR